MKKETKKLILGIVIGIILVIIINAVFSQILPDSSYKTEVRYYKDGELIGRSTSEDKNICEIGGSCRLFGANKYSFNVEPNNQLISVSKYDCENEFEKNGAQLDGFCKLERVLANKANSPGITSYSCECWSN